MAGLVRGRILIPLRSFVKETFGEQGWNRVLGELAPAHRQVLDGLIVPDSWYPRDLHRLLIQAIVRLWQDELPDVGRRCGIRAARHHDRFYLRPLLKLGGPMMVVKRAAALYREYFQGGEMSVIERRENGGRILLADELVVREFCGETFLGFIEELVRLAGKEPVRCLQTACRFEGAEHCEFDLEWK